MKFAFVKLENGNSGIIPVENIQKFKPQERRTKRFKVVWSDGKKYEAAVGYLGETEEEVREKCNSERSRIPPARFLDEASSSDFDPSTSKKNSAHVKANKQRGSKTQEIAQKKPDEKKYNFYQNKIHYLKQELEKKKLQFQSNEQNTHAKAKIDSQKDELLDALPDDARFSDKENYSNIIEKIYEVKLGKSGKIGDEIYSKKNQSSEYRTNAEPKISSENEDELSNAPPDDLGLNEEENYLNDIDEIYENKLEKDDEKGDEEINPKKNQGSEYRTNAEPKIGSQNEDQLSDAPPVDVGLNDQESDPNDIDKINENNLEKDGEKGDEEITPKKNQSREYRTNAKPKIGSQNEDQLSDAPPDDARLNDEGNVPNDIDNVNGDNPEESVNKIVAENDPKTTESEISSVETNTESGSDNSNLEDEISSEASEEELKSKKQNVSKIKVEIVELKKENKELNGTIKSLNSTINKLKKEKLVQEHKIEQYSCDVKDTKDLLAEALRSAIALQKEVIDRFDETHEIIRDLVGRNKETVTLNTGFPAVGYLRRNDMMRHCGQGFYLLDQQFRTLMGSKNGKMCVREAARLIFGIEVLRKSTPSGKTAKRLSKCKNSESREKLDSRLLQVVRDITQYYYMLEKNKNILQVEKDQVLFNVTDIVGAVCTELRKPKVVKETSKQNKAKKRKSPSNAKCTGKKIRKTNNNEELKKSTPDEANKATEAEFESFSPSNMDPASDSDNEN